MTFSAPANYLQQRQQAQQSPADFWQQQAAKIAWLKPPTTILQQDADGHGRWFADGELNSCDLALDVHLREGRGEQLVLIYDSPVTGQVQRFTYQQLHHEVATFAGALQNLGIGKGDRVVIYMPMIPQAVIAMLAVARLGAVHSVVFGGFSAHELAIRIDDATPKVVVSASCGIEISRVIAYKPLLDEALSLASHKVAQSIIFQRPQQRAEMITPRDIDWLECQSKASAAQCTPVLATDPLYILYTSGTTGKPKGVVRDNGGHAVALRYSMSAIYNCQPGDVFWAASDVGWVVGHSYIVYAPLFAGCTTVLYEGKPVFTPDASAFWRVCAEHHVKILFAAPTAFRAIRKEDPNAELQRYDLSKLKYIFMAGERLDPATFHWVQDTIGKPVIDHWWQTETGWPISANPAGLGLMGAKAGSSTVAVPGFNVAILDEAGQVITDHSQGYIALQLPLPPGCLSTIWGNHDRFIDGYLRTFPGYYASGDGGYLDADNYVFVMGRTDDVINVAGHRLSTGEMEQIVAAHPAVAECCVIGIHEAIKGQQPLALVLLKNGADIDETTLEAELVAMVRHDIGALACFKRAILVKRLPKTRSGKILRKLLRQIAAGESYTIPSTIDDPACLPEISEIMARNQLIAP